MLPALEKIGLAPLLIEEISVALAPLLVGFSGFCALLQGAVLVRAEGWRALWSEMRGQLLLSVLALSLVFLYIQHVAPYAERWLLFNYLTIALCGIVLVLQSQPHSSRG